MQLRKMTRCSVNFECIFVSSILFRETFCSTVLQHAVLLDYCFQFKYVSVFLFLKEADWSYQFERQGLDLEIDAL